MRRKDFSELLRVQWKKAFLLPTLLVGETWMRAQGRDDVRRKGVRKEVQERGETW